MKKFLFVLPVIFLVAAGCDSSTIKTTTQTTPTPQQQVSQNPTPTPTPSQTPVAVSNIFTYKAKPGDKVGGMVVAMVNSNDKNPVSADDIHAEFTGNITLTGRLSAPTGNPADAGMGPQYTLNDITKDSLKLLPYLQTDTRSSWFGVRNPDVMKNFQVKNGDMVEMTISRYYYTFWPADAWNEADVVSVKKVQSPTSVVQLEIKGWLEGTVGNWTLVEATPNLSGRSGNKFHLQILDSSQCVVILDSKTSNSFSCTSKNSTSKWGYGDRVRVFGTINIDGDGSFAVSKMEIVSAIPLESW
jgi:hypothetical protein